MAHTAPPVRAATELVAATVLGGAVLLVTLRAVGVSELQVVRSRAAGLLRRGKE
jgi:hypothetical protein